MHPLWSHPRWCNNVPVAVGDWKVCERGHVNDADAIVCADCASPLRPDAAVESQVVPPVPATGGRGRWWWLLAIAVVAVAVGGFALRPSGPDPRGPSEGMCRDPEGDLDGEYLSSGTTKQEGWLDLREVSVSIDADGRIIAEVDTSKSFPTAGDGSAPFSTGELEYRIDFWQGDEGGSTLWLVIEIDGGYGEYPVIATASIHQEGSGSSAPEPDVRGSTVTLRTPRKTIEPTQDWRFSATSTAELGHTADYCPNGATNVRLQPTA